MWSWLHRHNVPRIRTHSTNTHVVIRYEGRVNIWFIYQSVYIEKHKFRCRSLRYTKPSNNQNIPTISSEVKHALCLTDFLKCCHSVPSRRATRITRIDTLSFLSGDWNVSSAFETFNLLPASRFLTRVYFRVVFVWVWVWVWVSVSVLQRSRQDAGSGSQDHIFRGDVKAFITQFSIFEVRLARIYREWGFM